LNQFELIDRRLLNRNKELSALRAKVGNINVAIVEGGEYAVDPDSGIPVAQIDWSDELAEMLRQLRKEVEPLVDFAGVLIESDLPVIAKDIERLAESVPKRISQSASLEEVYRSEQTSVCGLLNLSDIDESIFSVDELDGLARELKDSHKKLADRLLSYKERIEKLDEAFAKLLEEGESINDPKELAERLREDIVEASQDLVAELGDDVLTMQLIQARARTESVLLPEVDVDPETAVRIARKNRRDWANARADSSILGAISRSLLTI
jgi:DNA repair exonuclease SbcCD ATPase subunit